MLLVELLQVPTLKKKKKKKRKKIGMIVFKEVKYSSCKSGLKLEYGPDVDYVDAFIQ